MKIMAIDPGNTESGYCIMDGYKPIEFGKLGNEELRKKIYGLDIGTISWPEKLAIEMVASYGMAVGREVFETCVWIGRFWEAFQQSDADVELIYRIEEKTMICHDSRAKDTNIRKALIDRFAEFDKTNGKGTKKKPDWFYGFSKDVWMAYAVGVTFLDKEQEKILKR